MKRIFIAFLVLVGISVTCVSGWAQATAQISGTVRDQSGAVLPGVEVTATQTDTGIRRQAISNETGTWILSNIAVGPYRVEASLPGFRTSIQTGIVLRRRRYQMTCLCPPAISEITRHICGCSAQSIKRCFSEPDRARSRKLHTRPVRPRAIPANGGDCSCRIPSRDSTTESTRRSKMAAPQTITGCFSPFSDGQFEV
jgi:carboxypeptidase family protein